MPTRISPQAWGCTGQEWHHHRDDHNLPTSVGMYRTAFWAVLGAAKSPHKRGDVPNKTGGSASDTGISPQAWGCTGLEFTLHLCSSNLPTSVGMYRVFSIQPPLVFQSPHKRGDVPKRDTLITVRREISPQAWGCTENQNPIGAHSRNLPTSVGMYRSLPEAPGISKKSPHKRGDVPRASDRFVYLFLISPQAWGCTGGRCHVDVESANLPTSVGMYRSRGNQYAL